MLLNQVYKKQFKLNVKFFCFQPKVVTATDEAELARLMEQAELENAEVSGDDNEEEEEENEENENNDEQKNETGEGDSE